MAPVTAAGGVTTTVVVGVVMVVGTTGVAGSAVTVVVGEAIPAGMAPCPFPFPLGPEPDFPGAFSCGIAPGPSPWDVAGMTGMALTVARNISRGVSSLGAFTTLVARMA